jgi:uncharacterized protein YfaP (DUF2135 family)
MHLSTTRSVVTGWLGVMALTLVAVDASAQSPGAPVVTVFPDNSLQITYSAPVPPPPGAQLRGTFNGAPIGPFAIGTNTTVSSGGPVAIGAYTVQVVWGSAVSPVTAFLVPTGTAVGVPLPTTMHPPSVTANSVVLSWDPISNATGYEVEAFVFSSGQTLSLQVGNQTSLTVPNVPLGNYSVRVRGRNAFSAGPFSNTVLVSILPTFRLRDLEISLTWNTQADIDLHVIEPNGRHVFWDARTGTTTVLDRDNTTGFGPEIASIERGRAIPGIYQVFIVHYRGDAPTTSTVAVTLNVGTPAARTAIFTRQTDAPDFQEGVNVALVDVASGVIGENFGRRSVPADPRASTVK